MPAQVTQLEMGSSDTICSPKTWENGIERGQMERRSKEGTKIQHSQEPGKGGKREGVTDLSLQLQTGYIRSVATGVLVGAQPKCIVE